MQHSRTVLYEFQHFAGIPFGFIQEGILRSHIIAKTSNHIVAPVDFDESSTGFISLLDDETDEFRAINGRVDDQVLAGLYVHAYFDGQFCIFFQFRLKIGHLRSPPYFGNRLLSYHTPSQNEFVMRVEGVSQ
ncbi:hypothetical protein D3C74_245530 [compost metagenome]